MFKFIFNTLYYLIFLSIVSLAILLVSSFFPFENWYQVKVVLSGSMEPAIHTGGIVIIKPVANYVVGDVITFGKDTKIDIPVTHRIVKEESKNARGSIFVTKGDANSDSDPGTVTEQEIIGKVALTLPYVGFLLEFTKTKVGLITLVIIPGVLIVLGELIKIASELMRIARDRRRTTTDHLNV